MLYVVFAILVGALWLHWEITDPDGHIYKMFN